MATEWRKLRQCWLDLEGYDGPLSLVWKDRKAGEPISSDLIDDLFGTGEAWVEQRKQVHQGILDRLVDAGALDAPVAKQLQLAFGEAAYHTWRSSIYLTCYHPTRLGLGFMRSRGSLMQQRELLLQMAESGSIDPETVSQAQAAISRDLAFFEAGAAVQEE